MTSVHFFLFETLRLFEIQNATLSWSNSAYPPLLCLLKYSPRFHKDQNHSISHSEPPLFSIYSHLLGHLKDQVLSVCERPQNGVLASNSFIWCFTCISNNMLKTEGLSSPSCHPPSTHAYSFPHLINSHLIFSVAHARDFKSSSWPPVFYFKHMPFTECLCYTLELKSFYCIILFFIFMLYSKSP